MFMIGSIDSTTYEQSKTKMMGKGITMGGGMEGQREVVWTKRRNEEQKKGRSREVGRDFMVFSLFSSTF